MAQQMRIFGSDLVDRMQHLDDRQERMRKFLLVAHLDRVRQLEYRVAAARARAGAHPALDGSADPVTG